MQHATWPTVNKCVTTAAGNERLRRWKLAAAAVPGQGHRAVTEHTDVTVQSHDRPTSN